ncbi:hypothetical protein SPSYN_01112 [Sporotomaculum syntrophicum]|uniref:Uncharacterized protein n=1 Tax=Sporotomaculum syntrophicum TaxID=182264 RepID=A0A9D2WQB7_9FIRM|nr:hypothetical protein SPSYN_01112 [Sporotomaculum syntrophicum]
MPVIEDKVFTLILNNYIIHEVDGVYIWLP